MKKIISALIVLIVVLSLCSCAKNVTDNGNKIEQEIQVLNEVNSGFHSVQKSYIDGEYVKKESVKECLQSAYNYALSLVADGVAEYAKIEEENLCVICKLTQGDKVIYIPKMEDIKAGGEVNRVLTVQPYYNTSIKSDAPDKAAKEIDTKIKSYCFNSTDNLDDKEVNFDSLKNLKGTKVVIWDGHGGYDSEDHSFIGVSLSYESLKRSEKYSSYCDGNQILESTEGDALLTSNFFKNYYNNGDLNGAVIYLGTCSSGHDSVLADTFISKGAKIVFGNTSTTRSDYDGKMIDSIFSAMSDGKTAKEALKIAKNKNGKKGPLIIDFFEFSRTEVKLFGKSANNYTLYKNKKNNQQNSGKDLNIVNKLCKSNWRECIFGGQGVKTEYEFSRDGKLIINNYLEGETVTSYSVIDSKSIQYETNGNVNTVMETPSDSIMYVSDDFFLLAENKKFGGEQTSKRLIGKSFHSDYLESKYSITELSFVFDMGYSNSSAICILKSSKDDYYGQSAYMSVSELSDDPIAILERRFFINGGGEYNTDDFIFNVFVKKTKDKNKFKVDIYDDGECISEQWTALD